MLLSAAKTYGQLAKQNKNIKPGTISIAISPLTIFEFEPTVNLHLMYKFNNKYSAAIEAGGIIKPLDKNEKGIMSVHEYTGWRFRPEFRFWEKATNKNNRGNFYIGIQGLIKIAEEQLYYTVQRGTPSGLLYMEAVEQNIDKTVLGLNFLAGEEVGIFNSKNFFADVYTGLGLRYKQFKDNVGTNFYKTSGLGFNNKNGFFPTVALGVRIGLKMN